MANVAVTTPQCQGIETLLKREEKHLLVRWTDRMDELGEFQYNP